VGSPLVAPEGGLGLRERSPELRRFVDLTRAALDAADPINFARYYGLRAAPAPDGAPMPPPGILVLNTAGDPVVPTSTGYAFARAAGELPFLPPVFADTFPSWAEYATPKALWDQLGGRTPNDILVETYALEGAARLGRIHGGPTCAPNYVPSGTCTSAPSPTACSNVLFDADWLSEGANPWNAPHPSVPLRLARIVDARATDSASLSQSWQPREVGVPFAAEGSAWTGSRALSAVVNAWLEPDGQHSFAAGNACEKFDDATYYDGLMVRFLATAGRDLYFLSHPSSHLCLERKTCPFFQ
jgi:hypothetical protein